MAGAFFLEQLALVIGQIVGQAAAQVGLGARAAARSTRASYSYQETASAESAGVSPVITSD